MFAIDDVRLLKELIAVADCGTVTAAAQKLNITQPALSRSIKRLEDQLGVVLLDRQKKNRVTLSDTGMHAVELARGIVWQVDSFASEVRRYDMAKRKVTIESCSEPIVWCVPPALMREFPGILVSSAVESSDGIAKGLRAGEIDIAFVSFPIDDEGIVCRPCCEEQLYLSVSPGNPLAECDSVSFSEIDGSSILLQRSIGDWEKVVERRLPHSERIVIDARQGLLEIAERSDILGFMSSLSIHVGRTAENRVAVPIRDSDATMPIYCAYRSDARQEFVDCVERAVRLLAEDKGEERLP